MPAAARVVELMRQGDSLWWFGDSGPEISSRPFWPQKRTVRAMLRRGELRWAEYLNDSHRESGIRELLLSSSAENIDDAGGES